MDAGFLCWRTIVQDRRFVVRAQSYVGPHFDGTPGKFGERDTQAYVDMRLHEPLPADMADLAEAYGRAYELVQQG